MLNRAKYIFITMITPIFFWFFTIGNDYCFEAAEAITKSEKAGAQTV